MFLFSLIYNDFYFWEQPRWFSSKYFCRKFEEVFHRDKFNDRQWRSSWNVVRTNWIVFIFCYKCHSGGRRRHNTRFLQQRVLMAYTALIYPTQKISHSNWLAMIGYHPVHWPKAACLCVHQGLALCSQIPPPFRLHRPAVSPPWHGLSF